MIEPTIGRVVWYHPSGAKGDPAPVFPDQPYVALVAGILSGGAKVNLAIFDHFGHQFAREGVYLRQDKEKVERGDAEWMPYQKGQAAKADAPLSSSFVEGLLNSVHERIGRLENHVSDIHGTVRAMSTPAEPPPPRAEDALVEAHKPDDGDPADPWLIGDNPPPFSGEIEPQPEGEQRQDGLISRPPENIKGIAVGEPIHGGPSAT